MQKSVFSHLNSFLDLSKLFRPTVIKARWESDSLKMFTMIFHYENPTTYSALFSVTTFDVKHMFCAECLDELYKNVVVKLKIH